MSIFVALIGLLGMAVFFIQGIVFLFQRKQIKKTLIYFVVSFVIGFVGVLMTPPSETSNEHPKTEESAEKPSNTEEKSDKTNTPTAEKTEKVDAAETPEITEIIKPTKTEKPISKPEQVKDENKNNNKAEKPTKPSNKKPIPADPIKEPEEVAVPESKEYTLLHGKLISTNKIGNSVVIKAKIKPSLNNKLTISQNFYNIEDLIKNQGADQLDEIQYWAVADMSNGSEEKVISFTVNKELISALLDKKVYPNELQDRVSDLWIHGSLK